jgi:putative membrane protein
MVYGPGFGLWWLFGLVFQLLFLAVIVIGVLLLARLVLRGWQPGRMGWNRSHALEELELRYARGEIDRTDYLQRRVDLGGGPPAGGPPGPPPPPPAA